VPFDLLQSVLIHDESSSRSPLLPSWTTWFERAGVPVDAMRYAITFQDPKMAQEAALAGHGFAMGMSCLVAADIAAGRLVAPFPIALPSAFSFWLVCSEARATTPKVMRFKDWIKRQAGAQQAQACAVR
jgi:LysR family glycine cleavage system transcriptional activator